MRLAQVLALGRASRLGCALGLGPVLRPACALGLGWALVLGCALGALGCKQQGSPEPSQSATRVPGSGGFTPEGDSAAYRSALHGSPSGAPSAAVPPTDAGEPDDLGLPAEDTISPLPHAPLTEPPPQRDVPTPHGRAGGTLD